MDWKTRKIDMPLTKMKKTEGRACLGEISSLVGHAGYLNEDVKEVVEYINLEFWGELQADNINLGNNSI